MNVQAGRQRGSSRPWMTTLLVLALVFLLGGKAQAALIAEWQFDRYTSRAAIDSLPAEYGTQQTTAGLTAPNLGGAAFDSVQGTTLNQAFPSAPNNALSMLHATDFTMTLNVSGTGLNSFVLTYATQQTPGANAIQTWYYSIDKGATYTAISGGDVIAGDSWGLATVDFSGITALNGAADVYFQDRFTFTGNFHMDFDNIAITAEPVPEPVNYALAGFGVILAGISVGRFYLARRQWEMLKS